MKNIKYKKCTKCGEEKELTTENWHRDKIKKDGYKGQCKECVKAHNEQYNQKNKERIAEQQKEYRAKNKERIAKYQKQYRESNKEEIARYKEQYNKEYRANNKEYYSEYQKQYYQSEQGRKTIIKAQQNRRARKAQLPNTLTTEEYENTLEYFNHSCAYCGCELTQDNHHMEHVYPISRGVYGTTKENCIPSCESCNSSKGPKTLAEWYVWTDDYSFERLLKIHEITSGGTEWIVSNN